MSDFSISGRSALRPQGFSGNCGAAAVWSVAIYWITRTMISCKSAYSYTHLDVYKRETKDRTHSLLSLVREKKMTEAHDDDAKSGPALIIEEPESFLHPSAQAEFGRLIQDLSEEFKVQVIVATHSPYLSLIHI